jgi:hypothetical protein
MSSGNWSLEDGQPGARHACVNPIRERRNIDFHAFARKSRALTVQWLVQQELGSQDHGEQARSRVIGCESAGGSVMLSQSRERLSGGVAICVGIGFGTISRVTILLPHAARSMI